MNLKLATATLGTALILAGSPALASAADKQAAPIRIDSVHTFAPQAATLPGTTAVARL